MQITYKRNGLKNYMIIRNEKDGSPGLREKMIIRNKIRHLAKMTPQSIDGKTYYYYDIQGRVNLEALFTGRCFRADELRTILKSLSEMLYELQRYMLSPDEVIFSPAAVWLSPDTLEPSFIYVPEMLPDECCSIRVLAQFFTEHVDGEDREAASMAYEYLEMVENGYIIPDVKEPQPDLCRTDETPPIDPDDYWDLKEGIADEMKPFFEDNGPDRQANRRAKTIPAVICLGTVIVAAGIYIAFVLRPDLFPVILSDEEYMIAGAGIAVAFALVLTGVIYMFGKKNDSEGKEGNEGTDLSGNDPSPAEMTYSGQNEEIYADREYSENKDPADEKTVLLKRTGSFSPAGRYPMLKYDDGRHVIIRRFPFIMGKMKTRVDEVIEGEGISRIHAMIKEQDGLYFISDLNSLNGTGVNGKMLEANETAEIYSGDIISLADTTLTFQAAAPEKTYAG